MYPEAWRYVRQPQLCHAMAWGWPASVIRRRYMPSSLAEQRQRLQ